MFKVKDRKHPLNKALFDTWSVNLAKLSEKEIETLKDKYLNTLYQRTRENYGKLKVSLTNSETKKDGKIDFKLEPTFNSGGKY